MLDENKIRGMILGAALGDALGVPHEFVNMGPYTGKLEYVTILKHGQRFGHPHKNWSILR